MGRRSSYTAKQKAEVVLSVLSKQTTIAEACRRHGITETTFARWREQAVPLVSGGREFSRASTTPAKRIQIIYRPALAA
jgi:transposase-like protein